MLMKRKSERRKVPENERREQGTRVFGEETFVREVNEEVNKVRRTSQDTAPSSGPNQSAKIHNAVLATVREGGTRCATSTDKEDHMRQDRDATANNLQLKLNDSKSDSEGIGHDEDDQAISGIHISNKSLFGSKTQGEPEKGSSIAEERISRTNNPPKQENTILRTPENVTGNNAPTKGHDLSKRKKAKSGVVYISRIPPGMDVGALRALVGRVGQLGRVWLRAESAEARAERRALGSSRRRGEFMDGWVEFVKRGDAKRAVELLNGQAMCGATRRGRWADDLWCMRFLKDYTWGDLVEETCGGGRERTLKVKAEVAAARRERNFVEERVAMARKMGKKEGEREGVRRFRQKRVIREREWEEDMDERKAREAMQRVDEEMESGKGREVDAELMGMLFKKRRKG